MITRKSLILFALVIAIVALFAANGVMAQYECPAPDSCTAVNYILTAVRGQSDEFPVKTTCYNSGGTESWTCYKYEYEYSGVGDISKIDHVFIAIPYNCFDPITVFENAFWGVPLQNYHVDYYDPCEGGGNDPFAEFVCSVRVVRISPQGNKVIFFADTDRNGSGSHFISAGKKKYGCDTPIVAPGYNPERPLGPLASTECIGINERLSMRVIRGPDGCEVDAYTVRFWLDNPTCTEDSGIELDPTIVTSTTLVCAGLDAKGCPECITGSGGTSPTYYSYTTASGYKITICYDLANPPSYGCD